MSFLKHPLWKHPITNMFLGVIGSLITASILNGVHIIEIRIPKTEILNDYGEVLSKAAEVIASSDKSIYLATDVPAMGNLSRPEQYKRYRTALELAKQREQSSNQILDVTWLRQKDQPKITKLEGLTSIDANKARAAHKKVRDLLIGSTTRERTLPVLLFFYMWTGESKDGKYGSVVAFNEGMDLDAPVKGFYSNSADVHTVLKRVQAVFASDGLENQAQTYYRELLGCGLNAKS